MGQKLKKNISTNGEVMLKISDLLFIGHDVQRFIASVI